MPAMPKVTFYFDLGSPYAYLAAERIERVLPGTEIVWQPVLVGGLFKLTGRSSWALGDHLRRQTGMAEIEARAERYGLPPLRWPDPWPGDYLYAMRAVTYAFERGAGEAMAHAAFRAAFGEGVNLSLAAPVLAAAAQAGLDPTEVQDAVGRPEVKLRLREATDAAHRAGVFGVPTFAVGDALFWGDDRLEDAAAAATK